MNHLPLFENVCILPLFLKDIFTWYRMLAWQIFPLSILTFFSPLSSSLYCVWGGVSSHLNHISLCSCHFFLWLPSIFSVSFPLSNCALLPHTHVYNPVAVAVLDFVLWFFMVERLWVFLFVCLCFFVCFLSEFCSLNWSA